MESYKNTSLICGIVCLVMAFLVNIICLIRGIISLVFAFKYKKLSGKLGVGFGLSLGGIIYSVLTFLFAFLLIFVIYTNLNNYDYTYDDNYNYNYNGDYSYDYDGEFYYKLNIK